MSAIRALAIVSIAVAIFHSGTAMAASPLKTLANLQGVCRDLRVLSHDFTDGCIPHLANESFANGRTGFTFALVTGSVVTFSGGARQVKQGADIAIQPIDTVIWGMGSGVQPISKPAVGQCKFSNPYKGKAYVVCAATGADGNYSGNFVTDGQRPSIRSF